MLKVYTGTVRGKYANKLDITVKSGEPAFAPTWEMVMDFKNGYTTPQQYTEIYKNRMRSSYLVYREKWDELLSRDEVVLVCYCPKGQFCHRHILAKILVKLGAQYLGEK